MSKIESLSLLYSFHYLLRDEKLMTNMKLDAERGHKILIDSGGFTNLKLRQAGKPEALSVEQYIEGCREHLVGRVWNYIQLDTPLQPEPSHRQLDTMLEAGLRPMPVFIVGDDMKRMEFLSSITPDHDVCVAGLAGARLGWMVNRLRNCYAASGNKARIHALAFVRFPTIYQLPITSADSSSWASGCRYGKTVLFDPKRGMPIFDNIQKHKKGNTLLADYVDKCGVSTKMLLDKSKSHGTYGPLTLITINSYLSLAEFSAKRGFLYFFAIPNTQWRKAILAVNETRRPDGSFDFNETLRLMS